ncbi:MAG: prepilin-type N-terminal cleavage/methylation domain-containing protein [bacterium]
MDTDKHRFLLTNSLAPLRPLLFLCALCVKLTRSLLRQFSVFSLRTPHSAIRNSNDGFTIVEIVVVVIILGLLLVPVMAALVRALTISNEDEYLAIAAFLAAEKMEETRTRANCYTDTVPPGCPEGGTAKDFQENFNQDPPPVGNCVFPSPFNKYKCTVDHSSKNGTADRVKEIQVRVWYDKDSDNTYDAGEEPSVFFETAITLRPPAW